MKRFLAFILVTVLILTGCGANNKAPAPTKDTDIKEDTTPDFGSMELDDPEMLQYVQDNVLATLEVDLNSDDYVVEEVQTAYVSEEFIEEIEYNSQSNVYFGYTLEEVEKQFKGEKFVFTLGDDGTTVVEAFEAYDDTHERFLKDVAIGSGVILVCVTVSVATGGAGLPAASMVFAASAKTGAVMAASSGAMGGIAAGITTGIQTKDFDQAQKAALSAAGKGFKWGAITGVVAGGASEAITIKKAKNAAEAAGNITKNAKVPSPRESELRALKKLGGEEQVTFAGGKEVPYGTQGATRPDIIRKTKDGLEAVEVKNYDLINNQQNLCDALENKSHSA